MYEEQTTCVDLEEDLMVAVLEQAKDDLLHTKRGSPGKRGKLSPSVRLRMEAYDWFMVDAVDHNKRLWPFSFTSICEYLDIDPDRFRREVFKQAMNPPQKVIVKDVTPTPVALTIETVTAVVHQWPNVY